MKKRTNDTHQSGLLRFVILAVVCVFTVGMLRVCAVWPAKESTDEVTADTAIVDDPNYALQSFTDLYQSGKLTCDKDTITIDDSASDYIRLRGTSGDLRETRFQLKGPYDFDTAKLQRIMINGAGPKDRTTQIELYLDGAKEAAAAITLPEQTEVDENTNVNQITNANQIVSDLNITGKHEVEIAVRQYMTNGEIADPAEETEVLLESIQFVAETIPLINIRIDETKGTIAAMNADEGHRTRCYGAIDIILPEARQGEYGDSFEGGTYELKFIKGRGNSTWTEGLRLPYKLKLAESADLFGMGANANWALLANAYDADLIRNAFTYEIGERMGLDYTPQTVSVDVVMNGQYLGNYLLSENVRIDSGRVEIDDLDQDTAGDNITGGYLIGTGSYGADEDAYLFRTNHGEDFHVDSPSDSDDPKYRDEIDYIINYMQRVENALYGEPDPETGVVEDPFELMDLDSAVKYYWAQELSANGDFFCTGSTYCYKPRDGKLYWGPLWDFDIAWAEITIEDDQWKNRDGWFQIMLSHEEFCEAAKEYYRNTLQPILEEMLAEDGYCNRYFEEIEYSAINNYAIWGITNTDGSDTFDPKQIRTVIENSHAKFVENASHRVIWCGENLNSLQTEQVQVVFLIEDEAVDTRIGYANKTIDPFPEKPEIPGQRFVEWKYDTIEFDGSPQVYPFNQYVPVPEEALERVDGKLTLYVYAELEERDENRTVTEVKFQQPTYHLYADPEIEENWIYIPLGIVPANGYTDEIKWTIDDDSIAAFVAGGDLMGLQPKNAGTATITGTLTDGTTVSLPITVDKATEGMDPSDFCVTDFRLSEETLTLHTGEHRLIGIEVVSPEEYLNLADELCFEYEWYLESGDACTVSSGNITAESIGTAVVVCKNTTSGVVRKCTVQVVE